jgi:hypothetical protein
MAKTVFVDGLAELDKIIEQTGAFKFKLYVPRAVASARDKPLRVWSTTDSTEHMVVMGTKDLIAVAKMRPGEHVPPGAITTTYFKL